jgi:hypothetical protein
VIDDRLAEAFEKQLRLLAGNSITARLPSDCAARLLISVEIKLEKR